MFRHITECITTVGHCFQGRPKTIPVDTDLYAAHLIRYIHRNPVEAKIVQLPEEWEYSDYLDWIEKKEIAPYKREFRDSYFKNADNYVKFVDEYSQKSDKATINKFLFDE